MIVLQSRDGWTQSVGETGFHIARDVDKTDGILTYLSKETLSLTSFLTSKSSDMQVSFPNEQGDMVEAPIPEQFRHTAALVGGKPVLSTDVSDLYTH